MTSLYDFIVENDKYGFDVYDTEWDVVVCWDYPDGNDSWARVCRWMQQNIKVVKQISENEVIADISGFVRDNIEIFKEFSREHNNERHIVKGLDEDSIYAGVCTCDSLMVGNYGDEDYLALARMLGLTGKSKSTKSRNKKSSTAKKPQIKKGVTAKR